jgi:hypothetical protein
MKWAHHVNGHCRCGCSWDCSKLLAPKHWEQKMVYTRSFPFHCCRSLVSAPWCLAPHSSFSSNLHSWKIANTIKLCQCILHQGCWATTNWYLEVAMGITIMCLQGMICCAQEFALKAVHVSIIAHVLTEAKLLIFFLCSPTDFGCSDNHSYTSHGTCLWTLPCGCEIRFHLL